MLKKFKRTFKFFNSSPNLSTELQTPAYIYYLTSSGYLIGNSKLTCSKEILSLALHRLLLVQSSLSWCSDFIFLFAPEDLRAFLYSSFSLIPHMSHVSKSSAVLQNIFRIWILHFCCFSSAAGHHDVLCGHCNC